MFLKWRILLKSVFAVQFDWNFGCGFVSRINFRIFSKKSGIMNLRTLFGSYVVLKRSWNKVDG